MDTTPKENVPSPCDFDQYLPWACKQYGVEAAVNIIRIRPIQHSNPQSERSKTKNKNKEKLLPSVKAENSTDRVDKTIVIDQPIDKNLEVINIYTKYNNSDNLEQLKFDKNKNIPREVLKIIQLILEYHTSLSSITINSGLNKASMHELNNLTLLSQITDICLDDTAIKDPHYEILLKNESNLRQLSLSRCKISDDIVKNIASLLFFPLPASKTLSMLNLASNKITDTGAKHLTEALRTNRHLAYLNLAGNLISDEGAGAILDALKEFLISDDELVTTGFRHMNYFKEKDLLTLQILSKMQAGDFEKRNSKSKLVSITSSDLYSLTKSEVHVSESVRNLNEDKVKNDVTTFLLKAKTMADSKMDEFTNPLSPKHRITRDGQIYCYGNNHLAYLNLCYNNLTYVTVKKIVTVLKSQKKFNRTPRGLVNIAIEGNCLPVDCLEFHLIDDILASNMKDDKASAKRKRSSRSRDTSSRQLR